MLKKPDTDNHIGNKIREARKREGLTLAQLAEQCGCSTSLISQIETGTVNPSFSTLKTIGEALETDMAMLVARDTAINSALFSLMTPRERKTLTTEGGVTFQLLSRGVDISCEFIRNEWPPQTSTGKELYTHEGEECGLLLEGELEVETNQGIHLMKPGDTITLRSTIPHRVSNPGKKKAVAIWINSVPYIFAIK
jgi:transcriptional regulator with XRE-family HTH domain